LYFDFCALCFTRGSYEQSTKIKVQSSKIE